MDLPSSNPVTLVVKAPNQRIADQTIECALGWTVKKLKEHLSSVYPSQPEEKEQKLIYSGRLLQDHLMLKDILRQYGEETQHTVHLVCSPTENKPGETFLSDHKMSAAEAGRPQTEGLRHRHPQTAPVTTTPLTHIPQGYGEQSAAWNQYLAQMGHQLPQMGGAPMAHPAMGYLSYSPQQYVYMQQMYAQYMQQYMHYYQTAGETAPPTTQPNATPPHNPQANQRNPPRPAENQNIRMNAQGGPVMDDDEDEFGQRDWLDWVYTFSRFGVLISIVYFYSTMSRFILVSIFFFLVYLYEKGFFSLRRRQPPAEAEQPVNEAEVPPPDQPQEGNPVPEPANQDENTPTTDAQSDTTEDIETNTEGETTSGTDSGEETPAEEENRGTIRGVLTLCWCFISTFFTSLVPQPPPAINAN